MATFITLARTDELTPGQGKLVEVNRKRIALFNAGGCYTPSMTGVYIGAPLYPKPRLSGDGSLPLAWRRIRFGDRERHPAAAGG
jgi:hypothetical protein